MAPAEAAEDVNALWAAVTALDSGPGTVPRGADDAKSIFGKHLGLQEAALRKFLQEAKTDPRFFEGRLRLARVLTIRAEIEGKQEYQAESEKLLDALEAEGTREQKAEVAFTRITQWMRRNRFPKAEQRKDLLAAAKEFKERFPFDRRLARLLVEVATRFEREPDVKRGLLDAAARATSDPDLRKRIADDHARIDLVGKTLSLKFTDLNGVHFRMEDFRGRPAVVLYFSGSSAPALDAWRSLNEALKKYPDAVKVGISLDEDRVAMERVRKVYGEGWVIAWDGRGWQSALARRWGVNALPTVWLVDPKGVVVSLDAMEDFRGQMEAITRGTQGSR